MPAHPYRYAAVLPALPRAMGHLLNLLAAVALLFWGTYLVCTGMLRVFGANLRTLLARSRGNRYSAAPPGNGHGVALFHRAYSHHQRRLYRLYPVGGASGAAPAAQAQTGAGPATAAPRPFGAGAAVAGEQDVTQRPVEQRGVGMVFQSYAPFAQMSAAANIGYGLRIRGVAAAEERRVVGELIELTRLNGLLAKRPG